MGFVKVVKNKAYFKRFQTQFRRRRECKTDYYARKRLIVQAKNKYNSHKYRLVVRLTDTTCICQIVYSDLQCDRVLASAYSSELPRYGLSVGLKNYPACYCTGLLVARRLLAKLGLDKIYPGVTKVTGEIAKTVENKVTYFVPKVDENKRPFKCSLDVGIRRTTTGCRIFGALKGAVDGGLNIPHSEKRFPGYNAESKSYDPKIHREKIFGKNISKYMKDLEKNDKEKYQKLFADYIKNGIKADGLEALYTKVHEAIRKDPSPKQKAVKDYKNAKFANKPKKSAAQFNDRIKQKKASYQKRTAEATA